MSDHDRRSQSLDQLMMSGGRADDETLGEDQDEGPQANNSIISTIENGHADPADDLDGYYPQVQDSNQMRPPPRARVDSVSSQMTDCNSPETIARLFGGSASQGNRRNAARPSPRPSPGPRTLNLGNSVLNRRARASSGDSSSSNNSSNRARALSRQRDLASRLQTGHERQAAEMTMPPQDTSNRSATPGGFQDAVNSYESAYFADSRYVLQRKHNKGKLSRDDELHWIRMEALRRQHQQRRGRSLTPADEDDENDEPSDPAAEAYSRIERSLQAKRQNNTATVEEEIQFLKYQQREQRRIDRQGQPPADSRGSTPSNASELFVNGRGTPLRGFEEIPGNRARGKFPRRKYVTTSEVARNRAEKARRAGQLPNRGDPRAAPRKGYGNDGRGRNLEFGDYFLKAIANEDRPDVIEIYLDHVAHEVAEEMQKKATLPVYGNTPLKDRLKQIRKSWNVKTKSFCKKYGLPPPPKVHVADDDEKHFNRIKSNIYHKIRGGQLDMQSACRFGVEANIEMCRWRAKYHQATGNTNAPSNLPDLSDLDGLKLPTSEEFDTAYKPKYDKIMEFVGQMFAECQDRIRVNHDRLHGLFSKVEIPDPYDEETSDEEEDEEDSEEAAVNAAIAADMAADKEDAAAEAGRYNATVEDDDETMFPDNAV